MRISTRIQLNTLVIVIVAVAIGAVLFGFDRKERRLQDRLEEFRGVTESASRLNSLTLEYLLNPTSKRVLTQWNGLHDAITRDLGAMRADSKEEQAIVDSLLEDNRDMKSLFGRLSALEEFNGSAETAPDGQAIVAGQVLFKTQAVSSGALQLERINGEYHTRNQRTTSLLIVLLIAGLVAVIAYMGLILDRTIVRPVQQLTAGARVIGSGQLKHRIGVVREDELGELSAAFNGMAEEVQKAHAELSQRVQDRTAALTRTNAQLEIVNRELESFSYSVSHDLRVPLRAIDGFSQILLEDYAGKLDADGQRLLNVVRDNTKRMGQLIDDILAFSRISRTEMALAPVDMSALVRDAIEQLKPAMAGRDIKIDVKPLPPTRGDGAMLRRVWSNLLDNAVKFTKPMPSATIDVGARSEPGETVYYVKDNGVGFDMQHVGKLFGAFQRLHGPEQFPGTGIGLATVKRIIVRSGGRVWAEGKVDEGATFYFALPANLQKS